MGNHWTFQLHVSSTWVGIRLHAEIQLSRLPASTLFWWGCDCHCHCEGVKTLSTVSLFTNDWSFKKVVNAYNYQPETASARGWVELITTCLSCIDSDLPYKSGVGRIILTTSVNFSWIIYLSQGKKSWNLSKLCCDKMISLENKPLFVFNYDSHTTYPSTH